MDKKKKPTTTLKEVRKRMKKMTIGEKKQQKEKETKEREKKEANKQKITQRVRVNVNVPSSYNPQMSGGLSGGFPQSFTSNEHTTLLKSINEQLKKKNEPVEIAQNFNIPQPKQIRTLETQTEPTQPRPEPIQIELPRPEPIQIKQPKPKPIRQEQSSYDKLEAELYKMIQEGETLLKERPKELPPQFSEKISPPPIPIIPEKKIPVVNKPVEKSGLSFIEQLKQKQEERQPRTTEEVQQMEKEINKNKPQLSLESSLKKELQKKVSEQPTRTEEDVIQIEEEIKKKRGKPKLTEEEKQRRAEMKKMKAEETRQKIYEINRLKEQDKKQMEKDKKKMIEEEERIKELEKRRKLNEKDNEKQQIRNRAFAELLKYSSIDEQKKLQEAYDTGFLDDDKIKANLKKLKFTPAEIKKLFSKPK